MFLQVPRFLGSLRHIQEVRESITDEPRSGRPPTAKNDENIVSHVPGHVRSDRWLTIRMIREQLELTHTSVHPILINDLEMRKICGKVKMTTEETGVTIFFMSTGDESWIFE